MRLTHPIFVTILFTGISLMVACGDEVKPREPIGERLDCDIVAIHSDYLSTSVSLLNGDGSLCADHVLHSGSKQPGLAATLSGDVVPASGVHPGGLVTLIDRYPSGTVTWMNPETLEVVGQLSVATGFAANPQDLIYLSETRAYVTRAAANPTPSVHASDFDEGGDVLIINPQERSIEGRIDLMAVTATKDGVALQPYPTSMVQIGEIVWVALGHQSADFGSGGEGLVVGIDTGTDAVVHTVSIPSMKNCTTLRGTADGARLWGACAGVFQEGLDEQLKRSGLFTINLGGDPPTLDWTMPSSSLGERPLGDVLSVVDADRVLCLKLGDLTLGLADQLVLVDRTTEEGTLLGVESDAYQLGGVLWHPGHAHALVADANLAEPAILVVDPWAEETLVGTNEANPSARLPPRHLGFFR